MGKRSDFVRRERDFYSTPIAAVEPLIPHLETKFSFVEPCAGDGRLVRHLESFGGTCVAQSDIEPLDPDVIKSDFFELKTFSSQIITNPPWDRKFLHPMMDHMIETKTSGWLLFDADWCHTKQSSPYMHYCSKIVSVGRVKWIEDSKMTGKDNCAWYHFHPYDNQTTVFIGR